MPRGVKKTEDPIQTSENNVTVDKEIESNVSDSIPDKSSGYDKSSELKKSTSKKTEKPEDKVQDTKLEIKVKSSEKSKKPEDTVEDKFYYIVRPVPMYLAKNVSSPMLALVSGKCRIRSREDDWIKITIGVPEKGSTTGYIQKFGAIIR